MTATVLTVSPWTRTTRLPRAPTIAPSTGTAEVTWPGTFVAAVLPVAAVTETSRVSFVREVDSSVNCENTAFSVVPQPGEK